MMSGPTKLGASLILALVLSAPVALPAPSKLAGSIAGYVKDQAGVPQMGATVLLFNHSERLIQRALTNESGIFGFPSLAPDIYSIRVTLASFMPAVRQKIGVQPGMQSLLYVDLAGVLSSIELVYAAPGQGALMSDDWKWTLRGSIATRAVLRMLPDFSASDPSQRDNVPGSMFSDTRGLLSLSGGDPGSLGGTTSQTDLGTAFAIATSFLGHNLVQLSGNFGYTSRTGMPAAGFRTSFRREASSSLIGSNPQVSVTVQQIYLPTRTGIALLGGPTDGLPALRTMSLSVHDSIALDDNVRLDYGSSFDSVSYLDRLNYASEFARLSYDLGSKGILLIAFSSGAPPTELQPASHQDVSEAGENTAPLAEDLAALSILPRVSLLDGHATLQRSQDMEIGYEKKVNRTTYDLTAYREAISNLSLTIAGADGAFAVGDVLPDIASNSSILDAGSLKTSGFAASVSQALGDRVELGASAGRGGALSLGGTEVAAATADELRSRFEGVQRFWASARASVKLPVTGTQISGSYEWTDYSAIMPSHFYLTQNLYPQPGLNIRVRQPLPSFPGMPGHLEATAELRNGLGQGYLPISENGQRVLLMQSPRAVRGALSFIF
jgi:hypothetical protein